MPHAANLSPAAVMMTTSPETIDKLELEFST